MQIHPLFSVKKAAETLGVEKQFLRTQLEQGMIRGEKRRVGERDKWFIYNGEVRDLRDTKRLHELLEKARRISTDDLGDFFDEDEEQVLEGLSEVNLNDGELVVSASVDHVNQLATTIQQPITDEFISEPVSASVIEDLSTEDLVFNDLFFEARIVDDLCVDDLFVERVEVIEPGDVDFPTAGEVVNTEDDTISGSTKISVDTMLQKLTAEFAFQLVEERNRVSELERQLEIKDESLRLLPDLEQRLKDELAVRQTHLDEVAQLKAQISSLEAERSQLAKPWWKKLFA